MIIFERSTQFSKWLKSLRDKTGHQHILARIRSATLGNFGDCESVGESVFEMRVHYGPGYRIYLTRREDVVYLLLLGGDKSTQDRDISRAREMAKRLEAREK
jgi:putative addiction module killer protein